MLFRCMILNVDWRLLSDFSIIFTFVWRNPEKSNHIHDVTFLFFFSTYFLMFFSYGFPIRCILFSSFFFCHSEKAAARNKQRSKYNDIFDEDQKRFSRNADLLHLIDRIDGKAAALSANTERCKMLKVYEREHVVIGSLCWCGCLRCAQPGAIPV